MEHDEHEMLVEYSEMTTFNFNSREYQNVRRDYLECKNWISKLGWHISNFLHSVTPARNY